MVTFQNLVDKLINFWRNKNCIFLYSLDLEVGAGTSHYYTFFKSLNYKNWNSIYIQSSRRFNDNFFYNKTNYLQKYYQFQVILKPVPKNIINLYLKFLKLIFPNFKNFDIKFYEDNWENPSLGALGYGWEILINNIEISQFTFFKQMGGINCYPILLEITYGLERLCMFLQNQANIFDIIWDKCKFYLNNNNYITYGDIHLYNELEYSIYRSYNYDINFLYNMFNLIELEVKNLIKFNLILISYEFVLKLCYIFNLIDSKNILSNFIKINYIRRIRSLACSVAKLYFKYL